MNEIQNTPELRFEGFAEPWEQKELGKLVDVCNGKDYKHLDKGDIPVYGTGGYMTSVSEALSYSEDAIGIGRKGTIDKPYILRAPFWTVDTLFYAIPKHEVDLDFALCLFSNINWRSKDESSGVPSLSKQTIDTTQAKIPEFAEQHIIGVFSHNLDSFIALHQRKYERLQHLKQALLRKMFPKPGEQVPELRFDGFTEPWKEYRLGDLGEVAMCKRIYKDQTSDSGDVPFFKIGTFGGKPDAYISNELFEEYRSKFPFPDAGDVLISAAGTIGRTVVYNGERAYYQDSNIVWLKHGDEINNLFFLQFLKVKDWKNLEGSTLKRLYNKDILETPIALPETAEQNAVGSFFRDIDSLIALHQRKYERLRRLKQALLRKMFV